MEQDEPVCEMVTERKCRDVQGELVLVFVFAFAFVFVFVFVFAFAFVFAFVFVFVVIYTPVFLQILDESHTQRQVKIYK